MPFSSKKYNVKKKNEEKKEKKNKTQVRCTKVKPQLNPHCSKCPHKPPQSVTPKDEKKFQKEKNYTKLYKITEKKKSKKKFHHFKKN